MIFERALRVCVGTALCGFLFACQSASPAADPPAAAQSSSDEQAELRAAFIASMQQQGDASYAARPMAQPTSGAGFHFAHAAQGWNARLETSGLTLSSSAGDWRFAMQLLPPACKSDLEKPLPQATGNRVSFARSDVTEWYVNGPLGLEQGFTAKANPCPGEALRIDIMLGGDLKARPAANGLILSDARGETALHYSDLFAQDASGKRVAAKFALDAGGQQVALIVDDAAARYPIIIDPLLWTNQKQLLASDRMANDSFGSSVAVIGDTAVIGAPSVNIGGQPYAGQVYVFTRSGGVWSESQKLNGAGSTNEFFGYSVALSSDTLAVGASHGGSGKPGMVYIFALDGGGKFKISQSFDSGEATGEDAFGLALALQGDRLIVGAPGAASGAFVNAGKAYYYTRTMAGSMFSQTQKIDAGMDAMDNNSFGAAVALDGETLAVGSGDSSNPDPFSRPGAVHVFINSGTFKVSQKLISSDRAGSDQFGNALALSKDTLVVGAKYVNLGKTALAGAAYVFTRPTATDLFGEKQKLVAADAGNAWFFGISCAISADMVIVGAQDAAATGLSQAGAVYVFRLSGTTYVPAPTLTSNPRTRGEQFGNALAVDGSTLFVGALTYNAPGASSAGAVYVFDGIMNNGTACTSGTQCSSGNCVDGVCCDTTCGGGGTDDCLACAVAAGAAKDGTCSRINVIVGYTCRPSAGACDVDDVCDGSSDSCPSDDKVPSGTSCRAAADVCDLADKCDGVSNACADTKKPMGTVCRQASGPCDVAESCTGTTNSCPTDAVASSATMCKDPGGNAICDPADYCDGTHKLCPTKWAASGTTCGTNLKCNGLGLCR